VIRSSYNKDNNEGNIEDETGKGFLFRVTKFALGERYTGSILLLAAQDDFVQNVRRLQFNGLVLDPGWRGLPSDRLVVRQSDVALLATHYRTGAPIADTG
jgi:hypothetical protein